MCLWQVSLYCPARNLGYTGRTAQPAVRVVLERISPKHRYEGELGRAK